MKDAFVVLYFVKFVRIHASSLINTEKTLNRHIDKFYNSNAVNVIVAELQITSFYKEQSLIKEKISRNVNKVLEN